MSLTALKMSYKAIKCPLNVHLKMSSDLPSPEFNSGSCTAFSGNVSSESYHLEQFLSLCLLSLIFLKNTDHLFCRMFLNWGLSDGLSCLNSGYAFFVGMSQSHGGCFSLHRIKSCKRLVGSITSDANFDHLAKEYLPSFSPVKLLFFSL